MTIHLPQFEIIITDNGRGFDLAATSAAPEAASPQTHGRSGNGLRNMRQRLADSGGECAVRSQAGSGTVVTLRIHLGQNLVSKS